MTALRVVESPLVLQAVDGDDPVAERVAAAVEELLPDAVPVRVMARLRRGRSHVSWVLDSSLGRLVGKVRLGGHDEVVLNRLAEHCRVWEHGIPVPKLLGIAASSEAVGGRLLIVSEYLPGRDADEASKSLSANAMAAVLHSAGTAVARLHEVPVETFGDSSTGLGIGPDTWGAVVASRVEGLARVYRDQNGMFEPAVTTLASAGLTLLSRLAAEVSPVVRPGVAHLDLHLPNILVDPAGRFRLLLDLEHVRRVDPVMDFVKPAMWMFEGQPEWAQAFVDGYRLFAQWPQRWPERLAVSTGLELLTGVNYWARVNDQSMREDYVRRLRVWLRSDGVNHVWPSALR